MLKRGGRRNKMQVLSYGYQDTINDLINDNDNEVSSLAKHLNHRKDLQVARVEHDYKAIEKVMNSKKMLKILSFVGMTIFYILFMVLMFMPYITNANSGIPFFIGAFVSALCFVGCAVYYFVVNKPQLQKVAIEALEQKSILDNAKAFQKFLIDAIDEGQYDNKQ